MGKKVLLMILDGWGIAQNKAVSAIEKAKTPFVDGLYLKYKHSKLQASGLAVGLPKGQMGNSEVGHMNIGAGRVVYQDLVKISKAAEDGSLGNNQVLQSAFDYAKTTNKKVHFIGLLSNGGVHSHTDHLKALCNQAEKDGIQDYFVHAFLDGRDTDPHSGKDNVAELHDFLSGTKGKIGSIIGRYYAMDRDKRWERVKLAYDLLVKGKGSPSTNLESSVQKSYDENITDEFVLPIVNVDDKGNPIARISEGDVVICFNFRTDRGRQLTVALTQENFPNEEMNTIPLHYVTMTNYDNSFKDVHVMFTKDDLKKTLGEVLQQHEKKQIRIAETEKYPHVTFFFNGGREIPFDGESRILCPSPKVATYDLQPEMSARDIRDNIVPELNSQEPDFICLNFANPDMVGHTGVFEAAVKACETVDQCAEAVCTAALNNNYATIIIADHGNSDIMINPDGSPHTAHTTNLVPCILVDSDFSGGLKDGKLGDLAPTILRLMDIPIPEEMSGNVLID